MIISTEAVTLQSRKYGDTSKIVSFYTKEEGIITVLVKGARNSKSKFGNCLEPLSCNYITFYKKPNRDLHLLSSAETLYPSRNIQKSLDHITAGLSILESVKLSQENNEKNEYLFDFLLRTLILLNEAKDNPYSLFVCFELELAKILGIEMDINQITKYSNGQGNMFIVFSLENGSLDSSINNGSQHSFRMNIETYKSLNSIASKSIEFSSEISLKIENIKELSNFFTHYFSYHLDKKFVLRSMNLLGV